MRLEERAAGSRGGGGGIHLALPFTLEGHSAARTAAEAAVSKSTLASGRVICGFMGGALCVCVSVCVYARARLFFFIFIVTQTKEKQG